MISLIVQARQGMQLDRLARGKQSISVDLKNKEGIEIIRKLASRADVLIEPFRTGISHHLCILFHLWYNWAFFKASWSALDLALRF
jgi:hypothetical protein